MSHCTASHLAAMREGSMKRLVKGALLVAGTEPLKLSLGRKRHGLLVR